MIRKYKLPIIGTAIVVRENRKEVVRGAPGDPVIVVPILEGLNDSYGYTCADPDLETETMEITLEADEKVHQWLEAELKSVPKPHDLIAKHGFKPLKRMDK